MRITPPLPRSGIAILMALFLAFLTLGCDPTPNQEKPNEETQKEQPHESQEEKAPDGGESIPEGGEVIPEGGEVIPEDPAEKPPEEPPVACDTPFTWPLPQSEVKITPSPTWANEIDLDDHSPFIVEPGNGQAAWVKFTIFLRDPQKVYFQNSNLFAYHFDFATAHLDPFKGKSRAEFDRQVLHKDNQEAVVGAVLFSPHGFSREYGILFERHDDYHPEMVRILYEAVKSKLKSAQPRADFYFPSFHQNESANRLRACYEQKGITVSSISRWLRSDQCYTTGWSLGRLQAFSGTEIDKAYQDGRLKPTDILLTDSVPSEIPHLAGVISTQPTTPNSHVVILAKTFQIPFGYILNEAKHQRLQSLVGKEIVLRVRQIHNCEIDIVDTTDNLDATTRAAMLERKKPQPINFPAISSPNKLHASTDGLLPKDIIYYGGKAANFGLLRKAIPNNSRVSIAFSFDLWTQFLQQTMPTNKTLAQEINERLQGFQYPPDMAQLKTQLKAIRDSIEKDTQFTAAQQQAIIAALAPFDPLRKIRFRSSTNVEDSDVFTGAGLYSSFSGCLRDDTDDDEIGPSHCDPNEKNERGVFRAIRRVYASFYNDNAYLERLRLNIPEDKVGMAILVHHSFPDEDELANGVATLQRDGQSFEYKIVTQAGATSVTNPDGSAQPEVVRGGQFSSSDVFFTLEQFSSLVPVGTYVMKWEDDYKAFAGFFKKVSVEFEKENPGITRYMLDFEYKKIKPNDLLVNQVRRIPLPSTEVNETPFFLGETQKQCTFQGEFEDVFANHRLKSIWAFTPRSVELTAQERQQPLFKSIDLSLIRTDGGITQLTGSPATWPNALHNTKDLFVEDSFTDGSGIHERTIKLSVEIPDKTSALQTPIILPSDLIFYASAAYKEAVPFLQYDLTAQTRTEETVRLVLDCPDSTLPAGSALQERTLNGPDGLQIKTSFYWPPGPTGITAGYTAPLVKWVKTEITGLTTQPITLTDFYSQTHRPEHHNFAENFLFEPALSPSLTQTQRDELNAKNIRAIHAHWDQQTTQFHILGLDNKLRAVNN